MVGAAAGCVNVGVRRIQVPVGGWSTPAHEHGREEEIFYVLSGRGLSGRRERPPRSAPATASSTCPAAARTLCTRSSRSTCSRSASAATTKHRLPAPWDVVRRQPHGRLVARGDQRRLDAVVLEGQLGPPPLPSEPAPRPPTIVNVEDVEAVTVERPRVVRTRRNLGRAVGSITTGIQHVEVAPGKESAPPHCHSLEEEIFVILDGDGVLILGDEATPLRAGHVISRPAGTGVAHMFRAGPSGSRISRTGCATTATSATTPARTRSRSRGSA